MRNLHPLNLLCLLNVVWDKTFAREYIGMKESQIKSIHPIDSSSDPWSMEHAVNLSFSFYYNINGIEDESDKDVISTYRSSEW